MLFECNEAVVFYLDLNVLNTGMWKNEKVEKEKKVLKNKGILRTSGNSGIYIVLN